MESKEGAEDSHVSWEDQLQQAEHLYSDFFPDLHLPGSSSSSSSSSTFSSLRNQKIRASSSFSSSSSSSPEEDDDEEDHSTLFNEKNFISTVLQLNITAGSEENYSPSREVFSEEEQGRRYSKATFEQVQLIDGIEEDLKAIATRICRLKNSLLVPKYFAQRDLDRVKGELAQLGGNLDKLQFERVDAIPTQTIFSGNEPVRRRRKSINRRCLLLKSEYDETVRLLDTISSLQREERKLRADQGLHYDDEGNLLRQNQSNATEAVDSLDDGYHESLRIPLLDGIDPRWTDMMALQKRVTATPLARRYAERMESLNMPLCDAIYEFLQDPPGHAQTLAVCGHQFHDEEFETNIEFLCSSTKLRSELKKLIFCECCLTDDACLLLAQYFHQFPNLTVLSLKQNAISSVGIGDIMRSLANNNGLMLDDLQLDGNQIDALGIVEITIALPFCPLLSSISLNSNPIGDLGVYFLMRGVLNKKRKAIRRLPIPPGEEANIYGIIREFGLDYEEFDCEVVPAADKEAPEGASASERTPLMELEGPEVGESRLTLKLSRSSLGSLMHQMEHGGSTCTPSVIESFSEGVEEGKDVDSSASFFDDEISALGESVAQRVAGAAGASNGIAEEKPEPEGENQTRGVDKWSRLRIKLTAVAAFASFARRGQWMRCLKLENCALSSASALIISHALRDNTYITDVYLGQNKELMSNPDSAKCFADLLSTSGNSIRVLSLKDTGINDLTVRYLAAGVNSKHCEHLEELDLSSCNLGSVGTTWLNSCTKKMFFDQLSLSSVPAASYAVDLL